MIFRQVFIHDMPDNLLRTAPAAIFEAYANQEKSKVSNG